MRTDPLALFLRIEHRFNQLKKSSALARLTQSPDAIDAVNTARLAIADDLERLLNLIKDEPFGEMLKLFKAVFSEWRDIHQEIAKNPANNWRTVSNALGAARELDRAIKFFDVMIEMYSLPPVMLKTCRTSTREAHHVSESSYRRRFARARSAVLAS